ncbi:MAG: disulfide bond formation protein B [Bdellovibrionales bacterium]
MKQIPLIFQPPIAALALGAAAAAGLLSAYIAQYGFGLQPCELCLWQRGPYWVALVLTMVVITSGRQAGVVPVCLLLLVLTWLTSAGLGVYHSGVEQHWWVHGGACGGGGAQALTPEMLREQLLAMPVTRCDEISWTFLGLSMATWNIPFSLALAVFSGMTYAKNYR